MGEESVRNGVIDRCQEIVELPLRAEFDETLRHHLSLFLGFGATGSDLVEQVRIGAIGQQALGIIEAVLVKEFT